MDDVLDNTERSVKRYLTSTIGKDLIELLARMAVVKPEDPELWLGQQLIQRSQTKTNTDTYTKAVNNVADVNNEGKTLAAQ